MPGFSVQSGALRRSVILQDVRPQAVNVFAKHLTKAASVPYLDRAQSVDRQSLQGATSAPTANTMLRPTDFATAQAKVSLACLFAGDHSAALNTIYNNSTNVLAQQEVMNFAKVYTQLSKTDGITAEQKEGLTKLATSFCKLILKDGLKEGKSGFSAWYPEVNKTYVSRGNLEQKLSKLVAEVITQRGGSTHQLGSVLMAREALPFICQYLEQQLNGELDPTTRDAVISVVDRCAMQVLTKMRDTRGDLLAKAGSGNTVGQLGRDLDLVEVLPQLLRETLGTTKQAGRGPDGAGIHAADTPAADYPEAAEPAMPAPAAEPGHLPGAKGRDSHDVYNITNNYYGNDRVDGIASQPVINITNNPVFNNGSEAQPGHHTAATNPGSEGKLPAQRFSRSKTITLDVPVSGTNHKFTPASEPMPVEGPSGLGLAPDVSHADANRPVFRSTLMIDRLKGVRNQKLEGASESVDARGAMDKLRSAFHQSMLSTPDNAPLSALAQVNSPLEDHLSFIPLGNKVSESYLKSAFFQTKYSGGDPLSAVAAHALVSDMRGVLQLTTEQELGHRDESFLKDFLAVRNEFLPANVRSTGKDYLAPMTEDQWGGVKKGLDQHPQRADIRTRLQTMARLTSIAEPGQWVEGAIVPRLLQWAGRKVECLAMPDAANILKPAGSAEKLTDKEQLPLSQTNTDVHSLDDASLGQRAAADADAPSAEREASFGFKHWIQPKITNLNLKSDVKASEAFFLAAMRNLLTPLNTMPMSDAEKAFVLARNGLLPVSDQSRFRGAAPTQDQKNIYLAALKDAIAQSTQKNEAKQFVEILLRDTTLGKHQPDAVIDGLKEALGVTDAAASLSWKPDNVTLSRDGQHLERFVAANGAR